MSAASASHVARILVVDDNPQNRQLAEAHLVAAGYAVAFAESGSEAIQRFQERPPDLVLLDVLMPGIDGFETCKRIRELRGGADVAVVFVTALTDFGSHQRAMASGADDFLSKPLNRTELLLRVRSLLWIKRLKDELKEGYELIRSQRDALLNAQRQREELMALVVHDLKNPLTGIIINAQLIAEASAISSLHESALEILGSAREMQQMVMNLLDISRSEDGALVPRWSAVDVTVLMRELEGVQRLRARERQQTLEIEIQPITITADRDLLRRLIENLLDNAMKYSPAKSTIRLVAATVEDRWLEIRVSDEGSGIPEACRDKVFEKYARLNPVADAHATSSRGLGLTFCRLAADVHGGRIWVEANQPCGSCFGVRVPVSQS